MKKNILNKMIITIQLILVLLSPTIIAFGNNNINNINNRKILVNSYMDGNVSITYQYYIDNNKQVFHGYFKTKQHITQRYQHQYGYVHTITTVDAHFEDGLRSGKWVILKTVEDRTRLVLHVEKCVQSWKKGIGNGEWSYLIHESHKNSTKSPWIHSVYKHFSATIKNHIATGDIIYQDGTTKSIIKTNIDGYLVGNNTLTFVTPNNGTYTETFECDNNGLLKIQTSYSSRNLNVNKIDYDKEKKIMFDSMNVKYKTEKDSVLIPRYKVINKNLNAMFDLEESFYKVNFPIEFRFTLMGIGKYFGINEKYIKPPISNRQEKLIYPIMGRYKYEQNLRILNVYRYTKYLANPELPQQTKRLLPK